MGSNLRVVAARILAKIHKSANYSVIMHWIFLKHVLEGVNCQGQWVICTPLECTTLQCKYILVHILIHILVHILVHKLVHILWV